MIDENIQALCNLLNRLSGVRTLSSCGGHYPRTSSSQEPRGKWVVFLAIDRTLEGWSSLKHLATLGDRWVAGTTLKVWPEGAGSDNDTGMYFELRGTDKMKPAITKYLSYYIKEEAA